MANFCQNCGHKLLPTNKFCTKCGTPVVEIEQSYVNFVDNPNTTAENVSSAVKENQNRFASTPQDFLNSKIPEQYRNLKIYIAAAAVLLATIFLVVTLSVVVVLQINPNNSPTVNNLSEEEFKNYVQPYDGIRLQKDTVDYLHRFSETELKDYAQYISLLDEISEADRLYTGHYRLPLQESYVSQFIPLADTDLIGEWEIIEVGGSKIFTGGDTITITEDGKYICGDKEGILHTFLITPGDNGKGSYSINTRNELSSKTFGPEWHYGMTKEPFGYLECIFVHKDFLNDSGVTPFYMTVKWQNDTYTEAELKVTSGLYNLKAHIRKK